MHFNDIKLVRTLTQKTCRRKDKAFAKLLFERVL